MRRAIFFETATIVIMLFVGLVLAVVDLSPTLLPYKPNLIILTLFYSILYISDRINIWSAWLIGLIVDVLDGFILGNNALQFAFFTTVCMIFAHRIRLYSVFQQTVLLLILCGLMMSIKYVLHTIIANNEISWHFWLEALTTVILWPVFYLALSGFRQKIYKSLFVN